MKFGTIWTEGRDRSSLKGNEVRVDCEQATDEDQPQIDGYRTTECLHWNYFYSSTESICYAIFGICGWKRTGMVHHKRMCYMRIAPMKNYIKNRPKCSPLPLDACNSTECQLMSAAPTFDWPRTYKQRCNEAKPEWIALVLSEYKWNVQRVLRNRTWTRFITMYFLSTRHAVSPEKGINIQHSVNSETCLALRLHGSIYTRPRSVSECRRTMRQGSSVVIVYNTWRQTRKKRKKKKKVK